LEARFIRGTDTSRSRVRKKKVIIDEKSDAEAERVLDMLVVLASGRPSGEVRKLFNGHLDKPGKMSTADTLHTLKTEELGMFEQDGLSALLSYAARKAAAKLPLKMLPQQYWRVAKRPLEHILESSE
jgi:hypothetical protein